MGHIQWEWGTHGKRAQTEAEWYSFSWRDQGRSPEGRPERCEGEPQDTGAFTQTQQCWSVSLECPGLFHKYPNTSRTEGRKEQEVSLEKQVEVGETMRSGWDRKASGQRVSETQRPAALVQIQIFEMTVALVMNLELNTRKTTLIWTTANPEIPLRGAVLFYPIGCHTSLWTNGTAPVGLDKALLLPLCWMWGPTQRTRRGGKRWCLWSAE